MYKDKVRFPPCFLSGSSLAHCVSKLNDGDDMCVCVCACVQNLVTVWSAPNYCSRCGNLASILAFNENLERDFKIFKWDEDAHKSYQSAGRPIYFL